MADKPKKIDMLEAERVIRAEWRKKFSDASEIEISMATMYAAEKRQGETDLPFSEWLDGDMADDEADPTK